MTATTPSIAQITTQPFHARTSPFLTPSTHTTPHTLSILHLRRDALVPTVLLPANDSGAETTGYAEGHVATTRFGSYPHSTLLGVPWGSQVRASRVDTGSRGRPPAKKAKRGDASANGGFTKQVGKEREKVEVGADGARGTKRKRLTPEPSTTSDHHTTQVAENVTPTTSRPPETQTHLQKATPAPTGFTHILPPTPESWTSSLPHRTQVIYTPDYSYVLQAMRVRPGSVILEAGGGSGSFTHAAARAVFSGYGSDDEGDRGSGNSGKVDGSDAQAGVNGRQAGRTKRQRGRVYTFEYHEPRARQLQKEIQEHGLDSVVTVTHRDVYKDGFCLDVRFVEQRRPSTIRTQQDQETQPPKRWTSASPTNLSLPDDPSSIRDQSPSNEKASIPTTTTTTTTTTASPIMSQHSPKATHIFLDLPAPWRCLPHLCRTPSSTFSTTPTTSSSSSPSPLNPLSPIHLISFLPCISQCTRLLSSLRSAGWVEIRMVALEHRRVEVRREIVGLGHKGERGVNAVARDVGEAMGRLRKVEEDGRRGRFGHSKVKGKAHVEGKDSRGEADMATEAGAEVEAQDIATNANPSDHAGPKQEDSNTKNADSHGPRDNEGQQKQKLPKTNSSGDNVMDTTKEKPYKQGRLTTRTESEIKSHTGYLVMAVLPVVWGEEQEKALKERMTKMKKR